ncbi:TPA: phospholipase D-like domain-containing protein [Haemophilus influenzae]|uniref:phospholipase D-like domain-containing protein n=2 Tax=Haemophilus influenzae TaxID=727 RepID=UPI000DD387BD|nr:phospholipase D-like domain-containing protein [Haemophilus influenzae]MCK9062082.1 phospholipase D-like domain-containing protein [Haemophilus influenzae]MCK9071770.1 phospholipase D-like domain-containing protein [Haemophilus influenzae]MCK9075471.1 phospholipase D-like domain-containing protein [Haemophilus influenzae]MCK9079740.1 phospholipase D-like domain-containing protein [Haemophilus influenzae]MCK9118976.1 phospholipase D-like domain-containing protein [Haemophilus influenzae]
MYKFAIFLRKDAQPNFFRNIILSTLNNNYFDKYVLCSAFFQENKFSTSSEVISAVNSTRTVNIDIYGLYRGTWNKQFNQFCSNMKNYYQNSSCSTNFYKFKPNSHAKIFIARKKGLPLISIIGSSNLSAGAFADRTSKDKWNQECDIVIWDDSDPSSKGIIQDILENVPEQLKSFIYIANYEQTYISSDISCLDKINRLEELMKNNSVTYSV